jgi:hypothetical protein
MNPTSAFLETDRPDRYIKQLVSHLGHRLDTSVDDAGTATVRMSNGSTCVLTPSTAGIEMHAEAADAESMARIQDVVGRHLIRFTKDETLSHDWA